MKRFHFRLETVLRWRDEQARAEETLLDRLRLERLAHQKALAHVANTLQREVQTTLASPQLDGAALAALDTFRRRAHRESLRIQAAIASCEQRIEKQKAAVREARRRHKLLQNLRDRRHQAWQAAFDLEIEQQAGELFLARHARALAATNRPAPPEET
jgi:flagellar biosynthesis chaperone FliJ